MRLSLLGFLLIACVGCSSPDAGDGLSTKDQAITSRTDEIVKKSGGKWESVSAEDKAYLTQEIGHGNEQSAKMFFLGSSGGLQGKGNPGGPSKAP